MFTSWWSRGSGAPAPDDATLAGPLQVMGSPVHVTGSADFRVAWTAPTGERRVGVSRDAASGTTVVAWARIDNLDEVRAALGNDRAPSSNAHVSEWLLAAYLAWGEDAPSRLIGDYSVVVHDPGRSALWAWRDTIGVRPLFQATAGDGYALSTSVAALVALPGVDTNLNEAWAVHHSLGLTMHHGSTPYSAIRRVTPGHWLRIDPEGTEVREYQKFDPTSPWREHIDPVWVTAMRDAFQTAVNDRLPTVGAVAVETTAGLDSSGITGMLAAGSAGAAERLRLFGVATFSDPAELLTATARMHQISTIEVDPAWEADELRTATERISAALGYRHTHGMVTSMIPTYRMAAGLGADTLYSGHGGDQCVSLPASKAILEWADRGDLWGATRQVVTRGWKAPVRVARQLRTWARTTDDQPPDVRSLWLETGIRPDALEAADAVDLLAQAYESWWARSVNAEIIDPSGRLLDEVRGYWSRRAEECSVAAALYGVEYVWPLLDARLIQQYLRTPTVEKYHGGWSRYLFRRVIDPLVPAAVTWRPSKVPGGAPAPADGGRGRRQDTLPLRIGQCHPLIARVLDPDVLACGEIGSMGSMTRMSRWRMREADEWLRQHHGDTGATVSAV